MANLDIEKEIWAARSDDSIIAGVDEAGRGPLAGPVVVAAVIADRNNLIDGVKDSKKLSIKKRQILASLIKENYHYGVSIVSAADIDKYNILQATIKGVIEAVQNLACNIKNKGLSAQIDCVLVDGNMSFSDNRFISIVKGDMKSHSIAAASIIAKTERDQIMERLSHKYPQYLWQKNSGYGTKEHVEAINKYGKTIEHRQSFKLKGEK